MSHKSDVIVIGGGVIGVCAAHYLCEHGRRVTLIEQGEIAAGSSYGNAGWIVPSHAVPLATPGALGQGLRWLLDAKSPFYIKPRLDWDLLAWLLRFALASNPKQVRRALPVLRDLSRASRALFDELALLDGVECGYERAGMLALFNTESGLAEGIEEAHLLQAHGISAQVLEAGGVRQMEPNVTPGVVGGIFYDEDAHLDPARFVRGLARRAEQHGVCVRTGTEVLGFETSGRRISAIQTTRGEFVPEEVVLAAGAWSPRVGRELGLRLPIQAAKGYSVTVRRPERSPRLPLMLAEARVAVTPLGPALRLAGTLEMAGLDFSINQRRVGAMRRAAKEYLEGMDALETMEIWRGLRPCTPDGLPALGRSRVYDNLTIAAGHAMIGLSLGPITGKVVAELVCGNRPSLDIAALRPERF